MDPPRVLYKYRSLTRQKDRDHTRDLIVDRKLYCACVDDFNDPFDCQADLVVRRGRPEEWKKLGYPGRPPRKAREKVKAKARRLLRRSVRKLGIFCSTLDPLSIPMWSYYTDGHKGICLGFRTTRTSGSPLWDSQQVEYSDEYPTYDPLLTLDERIGNQQATSLLLRKSTAWQHEREWRAFNTNGPGILDYRRNVLKEVVLGYRIEPKRRDEILAWVEESRQKVKVLQARQHDRHFRLKLDVIREP